MTTPNLVLSLFPGIGLLDRAFEECGFCVVRGPDLLWGGDVRTFHPPADVFDGVIGGPPCQAFSRLRHIVEHNGYQVAPNLIPEYERVVAEARPRWFVMENVPDAPPPAVGGYAVHAQLLRDVWVGGATMRMRRFSFGTHDGRRLHVEQRALHSADPELSPLASGGSRRVPVALGGSGKLKASARTGRTDRSRLNNRGYQNTATLGEAIRLQGLPAAFLEEAPFTIAGKLKAVGNGVPLPMGRAIARAVRATMYGAEVSDVA